MADPTNFRQERIEKLLHELRYEVERGMMERDIDETMGFRFYVPISNAIPSGVVKPSARSAGATSCRSRIRMRRSSCGSKNKTVTTTSKMTTAANSLAAKLTCAP
jgi:hypothetical protein